MEVRWSTPAAEDLERIFRRIEKDNPTAAREVVKTIYDGCEALKDFLHRGRPGRMKGRRELVFFLLPYIAVLSGQGVRRRNLPHLPRSAGLALALPVRLGVWTLTQRPSTSLAP
jgi:toxin ParE1/3/4